MILFEIKADGTVTSTPSLLPQGYVGADLVVVTDAEYALCTMKVILPSGIVLPDIIFTPHQTSGKTVWHAVAHPDFAMMSGYIKYQFFLTAPYGQVFTTQEAEMNIAKGVISNMPESVEGLDQYSIYALYQLLSNIYGVYLSADMLVDHHSNQIKQLFQDFDNLEEQLEDKTTQVTNALKELHTQIAEIEGLPAVSEKQNGYFLRVDDGKWKPVTMGELPFYYVVRFYNDDKKTVMYEEIVPLGGNAIYSGDTPVSALKADSSFAGFEPSPTNVTSDMDCYATYEYIDLLEHLPWDQISTLSQDGDAENYFSVGDTKTVHVEGKVGTLDVNDDYKAYILGFDHNKELEGGGITFGTFKGSTGINVCFADSDYDNLARTKKTFSLSHYGYNYGGWAGCDMRYDILGSTDSPPTGYGSATTADRKGNDPSDSCTTNPVENTLMAALPADLRQVMKPMRIYTDNRGGATTDESNVTSSLDYLPLLALFEVFGVTSGANPTEQYYQTQYTYFKDGGARVKHKHETPFDKLIWWLRSVGVDHENYFKCVDYNGNTNTQIATRSLGLAPIFRV